MLTMMHKVLKKLFHVFSSTFYLNLFLLIPSWPEAEVQQMTIWQNVNHKLRVKGSKTQRRKTKKCKQLRGLFFLGRKKSQGRKDKDGQSSYMTPLAASTFGSTTHYMSVVTCKPIALSPASCLYFKKVGQSYVTYSSLAAEEAGR